MGLFKRKAKPSPAPAPVVFITNERDTNLYAMTNTTRLFFVDTLIEPSYWDKTTDGTSHLIGPRVLPDRDSYSELRRQLGSIIGLSMDGELMESRIRCYPHYIALEWETEKQPDETVGEAEARIEREVVNLLGSYFGWEQPAEVGRFNSTRERYNTARRLGVSWDAGNI